MHLRLGCGVVINQLHTPICISAALHTTGRYTTERTASTRENVRIPQQIRGCGPNSQRLSSSWAGAPPQPKVQVPHWYEKSRFL